MSATVEYEPLYLRGIAHFNACEFFEAHEVWEELWSDYQGPSRRFFQGLIQSAVCLHHFGNGNCRGALKLYHGCRKYLEAFRPTHLGLDIDRFLNQLAACCGDLMEATDSFPDLELDPDKIPEIHLTPAPGGPAKPA
jgi:hypothetical protein